jgi:hypothetical protein
MSRGKNEDFCNIIVNFLRDDHHDDLLKRAFFFSKCCICVEEFTKLFHIHFYIWMVIFVREKNNMKKTEVFGIECGIFNMVKCFISMKTLTSNLLNAIE